MVVLTLRVFPSLARTFINIFLFTLEVAQCHKPFASRKSSHHGNGVFAQRDHEIIFQLLSPQLRSEMRNHVTVTSYLAQNVSQLSEGW